jgi:uncharacterized protein
MRIDVREIKRQPLDLELQEPVASFPALAALQDGGQVRFLSPVRARLQLSRCAELIEVTGQLQLEVEQDCSRCLAPCRQQLNVRFHQAFAEQLPEVACDGDEEDGLTADDMGLELYDGETIDVAGEIEQQLLLAMPSYPLCSEQCQGLCPQCGIDRNRERCDCTLPPARLSFAALKDFKVEK